MFVNEGKTYYSLKEASARTGYDEKTIKDLIKENSLEAEYVTGDWALTEMGMKKLELKKQRESKPLSKIPEPEKKTVKIKEAIQIKTQKNDHQNTIRFNTDKGQAVIEYARKVALYKRSTIKQVIIDLAYEGMEKRSALLDQYDQINAQRNKILEQM